MSMSEFIIPGRSCTAESGNSVRDTAPAAEHRSIPTIHIVVNRHHVDRPVVGQDARGAVYQSPNTMTNRPEDFL